MITIRRYLNQPAEVTYVPGDIERLPELAGKGRRIRNQFVMQALLGDGWNGIYLGILPPLTFAKVSIAHEEFAHPQPLPTSLHGKIRRRRNHR